MEVPAKLIFVLSYNIYAPLFSLHLMAHRLQASADLCCRF